MLSATESRRSGHLYGLSKVGYSNQGCGVGVARNRRFLGGLGVGFLTTLGVGFFVRLRQPNWIIFYITLRSTFLKTENSFCEPQFPLSASCYKLLTGKLRSLYVKESEIWERSDILSPNPKPRQQQLWLI